MHNKHPKNEHIQLSWPVPILTKKFEHAKEVNSKLIDLFTKHRSDKGKLNTKSYASSDDLHKHYSDVAEFAALSQFISNSVFEVASAMNGKHWHNMKIKDLRVNISGLWFQITNDYVFHEVHVHGNCSWSGVYYVQSGDCGVVKKDQELGFKNGITRFYGPHLEYQSAGHLDLGNCYTQDASFDSVPEDGKLVIFPSYLKHMPFPYVGDKDRIIVSFHAQITSEQSVRQNYTFS